MTFQENIKKNSIILPNAPDPVGSYVASKISGHLLFISGQISIDEKGNLIKGKLGNELSTEDGYKAAERCALSIVSQANKILKNDLNKIKSCVKLVGFVNSNENSLNLLRYIHSNVSVGLGTIIAIQFFKIQEDNLLKNIFDKKISYIGEVGEFSFEDKIVTHKLHIYQIFDNQFLKINY